MNNGDTNESDKPSAKKHWYAVAVGRKPGVYETWNECKEATNGCSKPKFRKFLSKDEAENFALGKLTRAAMLENLVNMMEENKRKREDERRRFASIESSCEDGESSVTGKNHKADAREMQTDNGKDVDKRDACDDNEEEAEEEARSGAGFLTMVKCVPKPDDKVHVWVEVEEGLLPKFALYFGSGDEKNACSLFNWPKPADRTRIGLAACARAISVTLMKKRESEQLAKLRARNETSAADTARQHESTRKTTLVIHVTTKHLQNSMISTLTKGTKRERDKNYDVNSIIMKQISKDFKVLVVMENNMGNDGTLGAFSLLKTFLK